MIHKSSCICCGTVASDYLPLLDVQHSEASAVDKDNWFSTGDVASIDPLGYMRITDRSKDVIKSGGEWISSIEIENMAVSHEQVTPRALQ